MSADPLLTLLNRFPDARRAGAGYSARCRAHDDRAASLSFRAADDGKSLIFCHAGCGLVDILAAVGLVPADLFPNGNGNGHKPHRPPVQRVTAHYDYADAGGTVRYRVLRREPGRDGKAKEFAHVRPDPDQLGQWLPNMDGVARLPYRLPELVAADPEAWVFVCEGEKDTESVRRLGLVATTNSGGATAWDPAFARYLRGRRVAVLEDNDPAGLARVDTVARSLYGLTARLVVVGFRELPEHGDASDWIALGHGRDDFLYRAEHAPEWSPSADPCGDRLEQMARDLAAANARADAAEAREAAILATLACPELTAQEVRVAVPLAYEILRRRGWASNAGKPLVPMPLAGIPAGMKPGAVGRAVDALATRVGWLRKVNDNYFDEDLGDFRTSLHLGGDFGDAVPQALGNLALAAKSAATPIPDKKWGGKRVPACSDCAPGTPVRVQRLLVVTCIGCGTVLLDETGDPDPDPEPEATPDGPQPDHPSSSDRSSNLKNGPHTGAGAAPEGLRNPLNVIGFKFEERSELTPEPDAPDAGLDTSDTLKGEESPISPPADLSMAHALHCRHAHGGQIAPTWRASWGGELCAACHPPPTARSGTTPGATKGAPGGS